MLPSIDEAEALLAEGEPLNPGNWGNHSRITAHCARKIAEHCGMDGEKAYILGLLHDIGRRFGVRHLGHASDGYRYLMELGYDEAARICMTHSFNNRTVSEYIGRVDTAPEEYDLIVRTLASIEYDDYDRLIQLCDAMAGGDAILDVEERMNDVKRRYGSYPQAKWDANLSLKTYFEEKSGMNLYEMVDRANFHL